LILFKVENEMHFDFLTLTFGDAWVADFLPGFLRCFSFDPLPLLAAGGCPPQFDTLA
jgi:hypothetical protein